MNSLDKPIISRQGIVLACFIGGVRNQVACVVESQTKPWKKRGQTGIVFETLEAEEKADKESVFRALNEELGLTDRSVVDRIEGKSGFVLDIESEEERIIFDVKVFLVQLKEGTKVTNILATTDELLDREMREVSTLNGGTRPGTILALQIALGLHKGNSITPTIYVRNGEEIPQNT